MVVGKDLPTAETFRVARFGSIFSTAPFTNDHAAGEIVEELPVSPNSAYCDVTIRLG